VTIKGAVVSTDTRTADRLEIAELFARLTQLLDERRFDEAHTVFHHDAVLHSPRADLRGLDELVAFLERSQVEGELTQHVTSDVLVQVDGDHAKTTANSQTFFYREGEPPHQTSGLRFACTAVRTPEGWRFDETRTTLAWTTKR
jgi:SnoaL-like protein